MVRRAAGRRGPHIRRFNTWCHVILGPLSSINATGIKFEKRGPSFDGTSRTNSICRTSDMVNYFEYSDIYLFSHSARDPVLSHLI